MNRGVDHQPVFLADADRVDFGQRLAWAHQQLGVTTLAYCLMDNHFHLLLRAPAGTLSKAMHHVMGVYTRHLNDRIGRDGPLFRGRFHSIPVETDAYLLQATRYIHRNALDLPGIRSPQDHRWSSYRAYLGLRPVPRFVDVSPVVAMLGGTAEVAAFTEEGTIDGRRPQAAPTLEDVRQVVDCALAVDDLTWRDDDCVRTKLARTVLILLADRHPDPNLRRLLLAHLAHPSPEAANRAVRRARHRHDTEPMVRRVLAWTERELAGQTGSDPVCPVAG